MCKPVRDFLVCLQSKFSFKDCIININGNFISITLTNKNVFMFIPTSLVDNETVKVIVYKFNSVQQVENVIFKIFNKILHLSVIFLKVHAKDSGELKHIREKLGTEFAKNVRQILVLTFLTKSYISKRKRHGDKGMGCGLGYYTMARIYKDSLV